jgi:multicomponent Na+:H+ antiporter subunit B
MKMQEIVVLKIVVRFLLPFIVIYALYILFNSENTPGGGFQAGVICASAFIVYSLVNDLASLQKFLPHFLVRLVTVVGIMLYAGVGFAGVFMGGRFLGFSQLGDLPADGQKLAVMLVESAIFMVVFSVVMLIFYSFGERSGDES